VIYRFAAFSVNTDTRELLAGGTERHLSPKAFDLLVMLLEQRAIALAKADLQERLWPTTFVGETNLATLVAEIRRALDDSAQGSTFVRTVHRFGYRFVAEVTERATGGRRDAAMHLETGGRRVPLAQGTALIGRAREAAIRIDAGGVSRHHARIVVTGDEARIEDLGSKNGTFVNGQPVTVPAPLKDGSEVRVGPVELTFRVISPTRATETMD
jgi:DNA-binding winged helix-turn-helix (wHTH) protein